MKLNTVIILIIVLVLAGLLTGAFFLGRKFAKTVVNESTIVHEHVTQIPTETVIIREKVPGKVDTVYVDGTAHEIARYRDVIVSDDEKVRVDLAVDYDCRENLFDVNAGIYAVRDSVYVEKLVTKEVQIKSKPVRLASNISIGFGSYEKDERDNSFGLVYSDISVGVRLFDSYSVSPFVGLQDTGRLIYGLRFGVDW